MPRPPGFHPQALANKRLGLKPLASVIPEQVPESANAKLLPQVVIKPGHQAIRRSNSNYKDSTDRLSCTATVLFVKAPYRTKFGKDASLPLKFVSHKKKEATIGNTKKQGRSS